VERRGEERRGEEPEPRARDRESFDCISKLLAARGESTLEVPDPATSHRRRGASPLPSPSPPRPAPREVREYLSIDIGDFTDQPVHILARAGAGSRSARCDVPCARSIRILFLSLSLVSRCFYSRMEMYSNDSRGDAALRDSSTRLKANARVSRRLEIDENVD